jgi:Zn-dependent protease
MASNRQGSIHLFKLAGVDLYLHWSWFLVAAYEVQSRSGRYSSIAWNVLEYLALFLIVLMHEFGHAMACRSVGGAANRILLWPMGGVAYVNPPQRPGAMLWSIAAGPLVNVALCPILLGAYYGAQALGWAASMPDAFELIRSILWIDIGLLVFNLLPIYPLDGGQIVRSLLWFVLGRGRSLMVTTVLGAFGVAGFVALAVWELWMGAIAVYVAMNCWSGFMQSRQLRKFEKLPRRAGFACPSCRTAPPMGEFWSCGQCRQSFDTFASGAVCPHCEAHYSTTTCLDCGQMSPIVDWSAGAAQAPGLVSSSFAAK